MSPETQFKMEVLSAKSIEERRQYLRRLEGFFRGHPPLAPDYSDIKEQIKYLRKSIVADEMLLEISAGFEKPEYNENKQQVDLSCFLPASLAMFILCLLTSMIMASMLDNNIIPKIPLLMGLCYCYLFQSFGFLIYGLGFMFRDIHR